MHISRRTFLNRCGAVCLAGPLLSRAAETAPPGFKSLFDGQTLDGWRESRIRDTARWTVENGAITGEQDPPGSGNGGVLLSEKTYGDFELLIDMKPDWNVNSGVFLRATEKGQSFQVKVDYHDNGDVGFIHGQGIGSINAKMFRLDGKTNSAGELVELSTTEPKKPNRYQRNPGLIHACKGAEFASAWNINDWNTARIRCIGKHPRITVWINDVKIHEFDAALYENEDFDREKVFEKKLGRAGHIGLQVHPGTNHWPKGAKCRWRNIFIKEL